jgi:glycosyltransferase involved in cell wall biosynthesis
MRNVTTIIAHKDYTEYLNKAIASAKNQTYPNKICVIDDGSKDQDSVIRTVFGYDAVNITHLPNNSGKLLENVNCQLFLMNRNGGPSAARNVGIKHNIEWTDAFQILDADDQMMPNKIELLVEEMEKDWKNIGIVYADYIIDKGDYQVMEFKHPYSKSLLSKECIIHSGSLINKSLFLSVGLYDESFRVCEDYDLWLRGCERFIALHVPEPLTLVLDHDQNSTNTVHNEIWQQSWLRLKKKHEK